MAKKQQKKWKLLGNGNKRIFRPYNLILSHLRWNFITGYNLKAQIPDLGLAETKQRHFNITLTFKAIQKYFHIEITNSVYTEHYNAACLYQFFSLDSQGLISWTLYTWLSSCQFMKKSHLFFSRKLSLLYHKFVTGNCTCILPYISGFLCNITLTKGHIQCHVTCKKSL
jgi:hypothetical protein